MNLVVVLGITALSSCLVDGRHVSKRSDDDNPLQAVVMNLSENLNQLKAKQTADVSRLETKLAALQVELDVARRHSAFLVQFSAPTLTATAASTPLKYDSIIFNDGNNYDPMLGVFTAPYSGVYVFSVKTFTGEHETQRPAVDLGPRAWTAQTCDPCSRPLVRNGHTVDRMAYDYLSSQTGHGGDSHSMSLTVRLAEGDRVWVQMVSGSTADQFYGQYHTSFSGTLIFSD